MELLAGMHLVSEPAIYCSHCTKSGQAIILQMPLQFLSQL